MEAQCSSLAFQGDDIALALTRLVALLTLINIGFTTDEHEVHQPSEFVGRGGVGAWFVHAPTQAPIRRPERRIAVRQTHGRHPKRLSPHGPITATNTPHPAICYIWA